MSWWAVVALALGLAMDAFAVAIGVGLILPRLSFRRVFRLSWHFGLFQFFMPILGWTAGLTVQKWIAAYDHWVAFGLLILIGGRMIYESFRLKPMAPNRDPTRGWNLVLLSIATSIDALAAGLSMAMLQMRVWLPCVVIGMVAGLMTVMGLYIGDRLGKNFGRRMELVGGLILIGIGAKILLEHLF